MSRLYSLRLEGLSAPKACGGGGGGGGRFSTTDQISNNRLNVSRCWDMGTTQEENEKHTQEEKEEHQSNNRLGSGGSEWVGGSCEELEVAIVLCFFSGCYVG